MHIIKSEVYEEVNDILPPSRVAAIFFSDYLVIYGGISID
jgi:hypothetical protein